MSPTHHFLGVHGCTDHPVIALASVGIISLKRQDVVTDNDGVAFRDVGTVLATWRWILMHMAQLLQVSQKQRILFIPIKLQPLPCASAMSADLAAACREWRISTIPVFEPIRLLKAIAEKA